VVLSQWNQSQPRASLFGDYQKSRNGHGFNSFIKVASKQGAEIYQSWIRKKASHFFWKNTTVSSRDSVFLGCRPRKLTEEGLVIIYWYSCFFAEDIGGPGDYSSLQQWPNQAKKRAKAKLFTLRMRVSLAGWRWPRNDRFLRHLSPHLEVEALLNRMVMRWKFENYRLDPYLEPAAVVLSARAIVLNCNCNGMSGLARSHIVLTQKIILYKKPDWWNTRRIHSNFELMEKWGPSISPGGSQSSFLRLYWYGDAKKIIIWFCRRDSCRKSSEPDLISTQKWNSMLIDVKLKLEHLEKSQEVLEVGGVDLHYAR